MTAHPFVTGGPVPPDSSVYIERNADGKARRHLARMEYITLIEPRQQGKSSLIHHLAKTMGPGYIFAYVIAPTLRTDHEAAWYASLCDLILLELDFALHSECPQLIHSSTTWYRFLFTLAEQAKKVGRSLVIALDEVDGVWMDWRIGFFSTIRAIFDQRPNKPCFRHLTFIIAGAYNPRELISDPRTSPFNVAQRVHLPDFTLAQTDQLVAHLELPAEDAAAIAQHIYYWTDGQPYLTQRLCRTLAEGEVPSTPEGVDIAVDRLYREDANHLPRILEALDPEKRPRLREYVERVLAGHRPQFRPVSEGRYHGPLALIGVLKADDQGCCKIRNRIYERALTEIEVPPVPKPADAPQPQHEFCYDAFISYSHKDSAWVRNTLLPHLEREGLCVCIDYRDFEVGVPSLVNMENAVKRSRKTLLVLTPDWVASKWTEFEALLIQTKDPVGRGRRILPLKVQPCELPDRLQIFTYLDLTDPAEFDFQMQRLVAAIHSAPPSPKPTKTIPVQRPTRPSRPMPRGFSQERGLATLGELLTQADVQARLDFAVLESRMLDNLQDERRYGTSGAIRSERARIVQELNGLALTHLGHSFNDLCQA